MFSLGSIGLGASVGITLWAGEVHFAAAVGLGGECEAMLTPLRGFSGRLLSMEEDESSVISPYRVGFFLSLALRRDDASSVTITNGFPRCLKVALESLLLSESWGSAPCSFADAWEDAVESFLFLGDPFLGDGW